MSWNLRNGCHTQAQKGNVSIRPRSIVGYVVFTRYEGRGVQYRPTATENGYTGRSNPPTALSAMGAGGQVVCPGGRDAPASKCLSDAFYRRNAQDRLTWGRHTRRHMGRTSLGLRHALQSSVVKTGHKSNSDCADAKLRGRVTALSGVPMTEARVTKSPVIGKPSRVVREWPRSGHPLRRPQRTRRTVRQPSPHKGVILLSKDSLQENQVAALTEQLESSEPETIRKALRRTASIASRKPELVQHMEELLPTLLRQLSHPDAAVCSASCWAVGHVGRRRPDWVDAVMPQLAHLTQHPSTRVREMAIWALGVIGRATPEMVAPYLSVILEGAKDAEGKVRLSAIWACENIATQRPEWFADYLPLFIEMLEDPDTKHVRGEVPELFRVIGKRRPDLVEWAVPELLRKLNDSDRVTRVHAAGALKAIRKAKGISK